MRFTKMHGAGNDYVYVDARGQERDWPALSVAMSDRHLGVGSDGLILALPSEKADLRMRMFNADGSEGEMCGNGIRCLVRFAFDNEIISAEKSPVRVETMAGVLDVTPLGDNGNGMTAARVLMGAPRLIPADIPVAIEGMDVVIDELLEVAGREFSMTCVSMGNPHAVVFMDDPVDDFPLTEIGPMVEHHPLFPARVNFEIVNVLDGGKVLKTRVWERGSGITMACGTGACAVQVAARLNGLAGDRVTIALPGGDLTVEWPGEGEVVMEGPVATVFDGEWRE
ncbi:MAG: diaminopimelate epimerase [Chloroflexi bacterium]|nr:diaminopimelate epimerase [Chloroflexota bacterium]